MGRFEPLPGFHKLSNKEQLFNTMCTERNMLSSGEDLGHFFRVSQGGLQEDLGRSFRVSQVVRRRTIIYYNVYYEEHVLL